MGSENTYWRSADLGEGKELEVAQGRLRYFEAGTGEPIVFCHGLLVNANLWRKVIPRLSGESRCVCLDLPLGSHELPMRPDADLSPIGLANLIGDAIEAIGLEGVTLVGNDTGGGLSQLVVAHRPERLGRVVLTSCDAYDQFPPTFFKVLLAPLLAPATVPVLFAPLRARAPRNLPLAFGWLMHAKLEPEAGDSYLLPALSSREIRRDVKKVFQGADARYLLEAAQRFSEFDRPVLIAWSRDDRFFKHEHAERLAREFPSARLAWIEDARTFSAEDQPARLAELVGDFVREGARATGD